ncbi:adenosine deaminase [Lentzea sp. DG1S-22]|uniref:adenosine deaminase n=1 Tax=Lentzea sp. DG1S-22 TaxID=3108822 RepID=UPI002E7A2815|nr:adenosine deaminase [Lentzea sp. DG1S-22]WVH84570.1 adenosine deaminase [Lentzea sp. DG1S-22]
MHISDFVHALPKAELHVHLVGAASIDTVLALARNHPGGRVPTDETELRKFYEFTDFRHFINVYGIVNDLVTTGEDVRTLVVGYARDAARTNIRYAELTISATSHLRAGIAPDELVEALNAGRDEALAVHGVTLQWIFDVPGVWDRDWGMTSARFATEHRPEGLVGFGLGGFESDSPRANFREAFAMARDAGLHMVPHAGETTPPSEIWAALHDLRAERIGHGVSAVQDPGLLRHLADEGVVVEVCPTSNLRTGAVRSFDEHHLPRLVEAGVPVTISTDDPGMFHTDLDREYLLCHERFGFGRDELAGLARAAVRASYAPAELKDQMLKEIDAV